jgi:AcrR family transcriptional regulator
MPVLTRDAKPPKPATAKFERRKEAVLAAAISVLNEAGFKGMTLADVAARVGLTTTSVTYYFKRKEDLAVACFRQGLERFEAMVDAAGGEPDLAGRLHRLLDLHLQMQGRARQGLEPPMTILSDIRALGEPHRSQMDAAFRRLFGKVRQLFEAPGHEGLDRIARSLRAHVLMEQLFWSMAWLPRFDVEDFPRIRERMFDILARGLAAPGRTWAPKPIAIPVPSDGDSPRETFLRAATPLINARSYRGVSVKDISARMGVTKGSFYHHMDAKEDIVIACFARTFETMRAAQLAAAALPGDQWEHLASAAADLIGRQVTEEGLLLRTSALQALPEPVRAATVWRSGRVSQRFASMISDGMAEGSVRPVDPFIAAQMVSAAINAAADLIAWNGLDEQTARDLYARPALMGLLAP